MSRVMDRISNSLSITGEHPLGFGEHDSSRTVKQMNAAHTLKIIAAGALVVGAVIAAVALSLSKVGLISVVIAGSSAAAAFALPTIFFIAMCVRYSKIRSATVGIVNRKDNKIPLRSKDYQTSCESIACLDSKDAYEWKKRLIKNAEYNVLISGSYCGGASFHEILDLLDRRMTEKPDLKAIILSSDRFLKKDHFQKAHALAKKYGDRFSLVQTPDNWRIGPGSLIKKTTNHTKAFIVDYGKYFMMGGSGIEDKYAFRNSLEMAELDANASSGKKQKETLLERLLPAGFRDLDFVFKSTPIEDKSLPEQAVGTRLYDEFLKLSYRWESLYPKKVISKHPFSLSVDLLQAPVLNVKDIQTEIAEFTNNPTKSTEDFMEVFCTGPEHKSSSFLAKMIEQIDQAGDGDEILIDHMYFHPPDKLRQALVDAVKRGAKLKIVTNGHGRINKGSKPLESPFFHFSFGARNRYEYSKLMNSMPKEYRKNVSIYEFAIPKVTLHRKVIVINSPKNNVACVIAGSGNIGYKSLENTADHEMNFICRSKAFAEETLKKLNEDILHSEKVQQVKKRQQKEKLSALIHRMLGPLIG